MTIQTARRIGGLTLLIGIGAAIALAVAWWPHALTQPRPPVSLPSVSEPKGTLRFVNFGDWGNSPEVDDEIYRQLERTYLQYRFTDIVTNGDNNYGSTESFPAYVQESLGSLLAAGVKLHFSLGNHDVDSDAKWEAQVGNSNWGEWGCRECNITQPKSSQSRYYSFYRAPVRFIMLDSNTLLTGDLEQMTWATQEIRASTRAGEPWQALVLHHPPFSAANTHGGVKALADQLAPVIATLGVDVVFTGHDHTYERIKTTPTCGRGVQYIVSGAMKLRRDDIKQPNDCTAAYWDDSQAFVLVEATTKQFKAQVINSEGKVVDRWELSK